MGPSEWAMSIAERIWSDPDMQHLEMNSETCLNIAYALDAINQGETDAKI